MIKIPKISLPFSPCYGTVVYGTDLEGSDIKSPV